MATAYVFEKAIAAAAADLEQWKQERDTLGPPLAGCDHDWLLIPGSTSVAGYWFCTKCCGRGNSSLSRRPL